MTIAQKINGPDYIYADNGAAPATAYCGLTHRSVVLPLVADAWPRRWESGRCSSLGDRRRGTTRDTAALVAKKLPYMLPRNVRLKHLWMQQSSPCFMFRSGWSSIDQSDMAEFKAAADKVDDLWLHYFNFRLKIWILSMEQRPGKSEEDRHMAFIHIDIASHLLRDCHMKNGPESSGWWYHKVLDVAHLWNHGVQNWICWLPNNVWRTWCYPKGKLNGCCRGNYQRMPDSSSRVEGRM